MSAARVLLARRRQLVGGERQLDLSSWFGDAGESSFEVLWADGDRVFCRGWRLDADGHRQAVLAVLPAMEHPLPATLDHLVHEFGLKDELDGVWSLRPLALAREGSRTMLVLEDPGGEPLDQLLGGPMIELGSFLLLAIGIAAALEAVHRRGLVHKDIKPSNILVNQANGQVWLTGFGIASRLPRERQAPEPPEFIAGTLAYMAPEQTGRMNRSIDARSDLYALGVTFYQMVTGSLPFTAADPLEWVHCQIARRPVPPSERLKTVPAPVSAIIMKLLAKTVEERYQTAGGLARDLRRCLAEWDARGRIDGFQLGQHDTPDRLLIPEKLYGREREVGQLLAAFGRVVEQGRPGLVLVSGYSGIGKSAVVHELHKVLVPPRGLFASGKFDQYKRDIPYSTLAQALQGLTRALLVKSEAELSHWRDDLREALGPNGRLMVDLVPDLNLILGEQPPVPELPPQQAQGRFQLVFRRFLSVFARPEHPLALFLDDLQWVDVATLDLLEDLLTQPDVGHLLLIGAYRDNEVDASHPLVRKREVFRQAGAHIQEISLPPLGRDDLGQLMADALHCAPEKAAQLAELVHDKTAGNPFFAIQFLSTLAEENLLAFDYEAACWRWDLERIHAKGYTDNVVDLMAAKLTSLPVATLNALHLLACLGNVAEVATLCLACGVSEQAIHAHLWEAVRQELILRLDGAYRFIHDRVQEAAYSLIQEDSRAAVHLRLGRLLVAHTRPEQRQEAIFGMVNQLNRGAALITEQQEREQLAELNLIAGQRAKASTAYAAALNYLSVGATLLTDSCWERRHELAFALELHRAECEFLTGALDQAEQRLAALSARAATTVERAAVAGLRMDLYVTCGQSSDAVAVGLEYLRSLGIEWLPHPTAAETRREYERTRSRLDRRRIEDLIELPLMTDPEALATRNVLIGLIIPATHIDRNLTTLTVCQAINLNLERGNNDASSVIYACLSAIAGDFSDYQAARRFGRIGHDLIEVCGKRFQARAYLDVGSLFWMTQVRAGRDLARLAFEVGNSTGELNYAAQACWLAITNRIAAGDPLAEMQQEAEAGLVFAEKVRFGLVIDILISQLGLIRTLRGLTRTFGSFSDSHFDELQIERHFATNPNLARAECWYWIRNLQARFFAGDCAAAIEAASRAQPLLWTSLSNFEATEYHFYSALSYAAFYGTLAPDQHAAFLSVLTAHHRRLSLWAEHCPENFSDRAALVGAEVARIEDRALDAMDGYEKAIRSARANGFIHNEALAYELAARFYAGREFEEIANLYLRKARYLYLRWGADGKVRQLEEMHQHLRTEEIPSAPTSTIGAPVEHLDLATVVRLSQAVSGEIVLDKLIETLMRTAIAQAGAERGVLVLSYGAEPRIEAEATTDGDAVFVQLRDAPVTAAMLPESALQYVLRTRDSVILDDAIAEPSFAEDSYIRSRQARSILCLPLINQAKLIGVLYLENNLASHVFAPGRITVLKLLASQAAIAVENTRLYRDLAEREARIRRLVDSNIIGIYIWELEGRILEANDAFLRIVGYDREDLVAGRLNWTELTPPEWRGRFASQITEVKMTGIIRPYEKEYLCKDGTRVPVLVGDAGFDETGAQGVAFVLDLTERKRAEETLQEVQRELAHTNRVTSMGQLTASIAHEVTQPIAATITNAQAALRWLDRQPPELEEARQALGRIVKDGDRAGDIIGRIRGLIKKAPPQKERFAFNDSILDVIAMTRSEVLRHGVSLQTQFATELPLVHGDRIQLQQVILNLILNAVEAMSDIGARRRELQVSTAREAAGGVLVAVRDSGPGLNPASVDRLFEAFYTTKPGGMGMGLAICRSVIEAHGGRLWACANEPLGAVFQFTVPAERDESVQTAHAV
jgi:PAS domain S-box-containing protein